MDQDFSEVCISCIILFQCFCREFLVLSAKKVYLIILQAQILRQDLENSRSCRQGLENSRGYPQTMIENLLSDIKFAERDSALLKHNSKEDKEILPFVTHYKPSVSTLKEVLMKKWNLVQNQPLLRQIFKESPIIFYKKGKSLKDMLVRAKIWKVNTRLHDGIDVR